MEKLILWEALYCECIHESSFATISLHKTQEGAKKAIDIHRGFKEVEFNKLFSGDEKSSFDIKFGEHEAWGVRPIEVEE